MVDAALDKVIREGVMKAVDLTPNGDGTWTARIFGATYTASREQCEQWLRNNGESY